MTKIDLPPKKTLKDNIFAKYFLLFSTIMLVVLTILGTTLTVLVGAYTQRQTTDLLMENVESIANSVSSNLLVADMNDNYSDEKEMICRALKIISNSVDADIFVCDTEGNIILCKERADSLPFFGKFGNCSYHTDYNISDTILRQVYESSYVGNGVISGQRSYIVGCPIYSSNQIIGSVFATSRATTAELVHAVFKIFLCCAILCLLLSFVCIWHLTRSFVKPLRDMSNAAKQFAIGDFSYRVKVKGCDELAELGKAFNE